MFRFDTPRADILRWEQSFFIAKLSQKLRCDKIPSALYSVAQQKRNFRQTDFIKDKVHGYFFDGGVP